MTQHDDHAPEGLAADLPHLTRRRLLVTGQAMGGAALSLWAVRGRAQTVTGTGADGAACVALAATYAADPRYAASANAFGSVSLQRDGVFRGSSRAELQARVLTVSGDPGAGYRARTTVGLLV